MELGWFLESVFLIPSSYIWRTTITTMNTINTGFLKQNAFVLYSIQISWKKVDSTITFNRLNDIRKYGMGCNPHRICWMNTNNLIWTSRCFMMINFKRFGFQLQRKPQPFSWIHGIYMQTIFTQWLSPARPWNCYPLKIDGIESLAKRFWNFKRNWTLNAQ